MFRIVSIVVFISTFVCIGICCLVSPCSAECHWGPLSILRRIIHLFTLLLLEQKLSLIGVLKKLIYLLALLCFVILAITGFYQRLILDEPISGYLMMVHATFAPIFAICLAALAVMWASGHRLNRNDCPWFQRFLRRVVKQRLFSSVVESGCINSLLLEKITFWLIIFLALPLILSVIMSMFNLFGTHWQELLLATHRWTALVFAIVAIVHTYLVIRIQMKQ
jgi:cytochrome b subunit of formate dehydrogenase